MQATINSIAWNPTAHIIAYAAEANRDATAVRFFFFVRVLDSDSVLITSHHQARSINGNVHILVPTGSGAVNQ